MTLKRRGTAVRCTCSDITSSAAWPRAMYSCTPPACKTSALALTGFQKRAANRNAGVTGLSWAIRSSVFFRAFCINTPVLTRPDLPSPLSTGNKARVNSKCCNASMVLYAWPVINSLQTSSNKRAGGMSFSNGAISVTYFAVSSLNSTPSLATNRAARSRRTGSSR